MVLSYVGYDWRKRKYHYVPPLKQNLAKKFGHDGQGVDFDAKYLANPSPLKQSVTVNGDGLVEWMPGYSESAVIRYYQWAGGIVICNDLAVGFECKRLAGDGRRADYHESLHVNAQGACECPNSGHTFVRQFDSQ